MVSRASHTSLRFLTSVKYEIIEHGLHILHLSSDTVALKLACGMRWRESRPECHFKGRANARKENLARSLSLAVFSQIVHRVNQREN